MVNRGKTSQCEAYSLWSLIQGNTETKGAGILNKTQVLDEFSGSGHICGANRQAMSLVGTLIQMSSIRSLPNLLCSRENMSSFIQTDTGIQRHMHGT